MKFELPGLSPVHGKHTHTSTADAYADLARQSRKPMPAVERDLTLRRGVYVMAERTAPEPESYRPLMREERRMRGLRRMDPRSMDSQISYPVDIGRSCSAAIWYVSDEYARDGSVVRRQWNNNHDWMADVERARP